MLVDTHAHLTDPKLKNNLPEILDACKQAGVEKIISIGCTLKEAKESIEIASQYDAIYATVGLYPHDNVEETHLSDKDRLEQLVKLIEKPKVVAIGECGLDFKEVNHPEIFRERDAQVELFEAQLALAKLHNLPLIIHSRQATTETLEVLKKYKDVKKVWHCFAEDSEIAKKALDLNCFISFTGMITFPKYADIREAVKIIPLDRLLIETDSPYIVPQAAREQKIKINNPSYVKMIAQEVASLKNINFNLAEEATYNNAIKFFLI